MPKRCISIVLLSLSKAGKVPAAQALVLWLMNDLLLESCQRLGAFWLSIHEPVMVQGYI